MQRKMSPMVSQDKVMAGLMPSVARFSTLSEPKARRWSAEEFYRLLDEGYFLGQRIELLEGDINEMAPQNNWHALGIGLGDEALRNAFGTKYWVRVQMSLDLTP